MKKISCIICTRIEDASTIQIVADEERVGLTNGRNIAVLEGRRTPATYAVLRREMELLKETYEAIFAGAEAFLRAEYTICAIFVMVFSVIIFVFISIGQNPTLGSIYFLCSIPPIESLSIGFLTTVSFILGAGTSIASGYIGNTELTYMQQSCLSLFHIMMQGCGWQCSPTCARP